MADFQTIRALIIEDDQTSISVLRTLLAQMGIETVEITGSTHSIPDELQKVLRPHVIFLDLEMPGINGYDALVLIRSNPHFEAVPVVAYTTHTSHLNRARSAGFHSFLGKPLNPAQFREQVSRILDNIPVWEVQ